jgi:signal transduction histidine kinase
LRLGAALALTLIALVGNYIIPQLTVASSVLLFSALLLIFLDGIYWWCHNKLVKHHDADRYAKGATLNIMIQMVLDYAVLGYLVYLFGGLESPMVYLFLIHVILACLFFRKLVSFFYMLLGLLIITIVVVGGHFNIVPHHHFMDGTFEDILSSRSDFYFTYYIGLVFIYLVVWYIISMITDTLKVQEDSLQKKIMRMVKMNEERTRYMLTTTHELKAPFAAIQSYINLVLGGYVGEVGDDMKSVVLKIKERCDRLMNLITEMLQLANLKSQRSEKIARSKVDLCETIKKIVALFKGTSKTKGLTFNLTGMDVDFHILANQEQVEILLSNVISNAVNYSYPDTIIDVRIGEREGRIVIEVEDRGIGIKVEHLDKVCLEYFRTEEAVKLNKNSTGLGMAIAKYIMDVCLGRIWMISELKKGTIVFLEFPR